MANLASASTWLAFPLQPLDPVTTLRMAEPASAAIDVSREALVFGDELGRGGMGVVYRAEQSRLSRSVAVKMSRPDRGDAGDSLLLREGRIAGRLEHPNIVPVHDLLLNPVGRPQLVLKCIDGVSWDEVIADEWRLPSEGKPDPLGWHLGVLLQVCNAVAFAHDQGVLHRDLKPSNVMVGHYGEVCVVDWGVAVTLDRDAQGCVAEVVNQSSVVGTLAYMPPEMLRSDASALGRWSDVYLLCSTLYQVLSGQPPRMHATLEAYRESCDTLPPLDEDWPLALRELLTWGFAAEPGDRPTLPEFRVAIAQFLARRDAEALLTRTLASLATLEALLARKNHELDEHQQIYNLYGACQFGLSEVVRRLPEHAQARDAWSRLIEGMVNYELGRGGTSSARVLLSQWADPPEALIERLAQAEYKAELSRQSEVEVLRDASTSMGRGERLGMFAVVGTVWLVLPLVMSLAGLERDYPRMFLRSSIVIVAYGAGMVAFYRPWMNTRLNRDVALLVGLSPFFGLVTTSVLFGLGASAPMATVVRALIDAFLILVGVALIDHRAWPAGVAFLGAVLLAAWAPAYHTPLLMSGTLVLVANTTYIWWAPKT